MQVDPLETSAARDRTLDRMVEYFVRREGTVALFLSGSLAAGTADAHSDIDFRAVVSRERHERFLLERESAPAAWGDVLFTQVPPESIHSVSHFRPFFKVDVFYYRPDLLVPSPWHTLPTRVLYDPESLVQRVLDASRGLPFVPPAAEVERCIGFGLSAEHEAYRRAFRGELAYAAAILDELRQAIAVADDYLGGRPWQGLSHFETRADPALVAAIHQSYGPLEQADLYRGLLGLTELFRAQMLRLHRQFSLTRGLQQDLDAIEIIAAYGRQ
jgi:predicted nucleotidyltransferase